MARGIFKYKGCKVWYIRYAGLDGRVVTESSHSRHFKNAQDLLIKRKQSIAEGKHPDIVKRIANHTFKELAEKYMDWIEGIQLSAQVKGYIIKGLLERFGALQLRRFGTALIDQLQSDFVARGLKNSSVNKYMNVLKHMFSKAVDWEMVESDTLKRIRKVKPLRDDSRRLRFIAQEECQTLINSCEPHLTPIVITALNTGMRKSEILKLEWDNNIDLKHDFILLSKTKNGEKREIPINATLRKTLVNLTRRLDVPYVFYDPKKAKPYKDVKRSFKTAVRRAGIRDFHFHDMRHTFASHLVMAGVDLTTVKELLGHKDIKMTLRYAHLAPAHKKRAVEILDNTITQKMTTPLKAVNLQV